MSLIYKGPLTLRPVIEDAYRKVSLNHQRPETKITVGFPGVVDGVPATYPHVMLAVDDLDRFVDQKINELMTIRSHAGNRPSNDAERRLLRDIGSTGFYSSDRQQEYYSGYFYQRNSDTIFLDTIFAMMHMFGNGRIEGRTNWTGIEVYYDANLTEILDHEMVHYDMGLSVPNLEVQQLHSEAVSILLGMQRSAEAFDRGPKEFRRWKDGDGKQFFEYLQRTQGTISQEAGYNAYRDLQLRILAVDERMQALNIGIAEEAVAYNFGLGRDQFMVFANGRPDMTRLSEVYETISRRLICDGKVGTILDTRRRIDRSYSDNVDMLDMILD